MNQFLIFIMTISLMTAPSFGAEKKKPKAAPATKAAATKAAATKAPAPAKAPAAPKAAPAPAPVAPVAPIAKAPEFKRLDPHGSVDMDFTPQDQCKACHIMKADGGFEKKKDIDSLCAGCHGKLPHSGVLEHMGDEKGGGAGLTCLSCHRPHRAKMDGNAPSPIKRSTLVKVKRENLPSGLVDRPSTGASGAMLDHPCTECHSW